MPKSVLLLKAADEPYKAAFKRHETFDYSQREMVVHFTDVLTFHYLHQLQLVNVLTHLERYSGILVTSPRSAIAIVNAVNGLDVESRQHVLETLRLTPVFSVGAATSRELLPLGVVCRGDTAGSAHMLAEQLHHEDGLPVDCKDKPMMFLCGDKRSDVLPDSFRSRSLPLEELVVYQTCAVENVEFPVACKVPDWIVLFSPSGLKVIKDLHLPWKSIRKAAIGKTTAAALHNHASATAQPFWEADVIAPKPTPESLADAIFTFEDERNSREDKTIATRSKLNQQRTG